jgi:hypothetical protein
MNSPGQDRFGDFQNYYKTNFISSIANKLWLPVRPKGRTRGEKPFIAIPAWNVGFG